MKFKVKEHCEVQRALAHIHLAIGALLASNSTAVMQHLEACESIVFQYDIDPLNPPEEPVYDEDADRLPLAPGVTEVDDVVHASTDEPCLLPSGHAGRHRSLERSWV